MGIALWNLLPPRDRFEYQQHGCITGAGSFAGALSGATAEVLLAAASILFSVCILLIPFLARRIVEGDLGSSMFTVLGAAAALAQSAVAVATGSSEGFGKVASAGGDGGGGSVSSGASGSSSSSPTGPSSPIADSAGTGSSAGAVAGGGEPSPERAAPLVETAEVDGDPRLYPHAIGWLTGAAAALGVRGGQRALSAGRSLAARVGGDASSASD